MVLFLFTETRVFSIHLLCTPWQNYGIYRFDLPISSVISGMRGPKAGAGPPRESNFVYVHISSDGLTVRLLFR